jgi:Lon-like ATP-dependent protease
MERDDKETLIEKYRKQLSEYPVIPEEVMEVIEAELEKFSTLEKNSPEYQVTRTYLDWLTAVPWSVVTEENYDIQQARKVLTGIITVWTMSGYDFTICHWQLKGIVEGKIFCAAGLQE